MTERKCRMCGCTEFDACRHPDDVPCVWHDDDLCSLCGEYLYGNPLFQEIGEERWRQDCKWGGPGHDDKLSQEYWTGLLTRILGEAIMAYRAGDIVEYRRVMVQVAAVAVAVVESHDRDKAAAAEADAVLGKEA